MKNNNKNSKNEYVESWDTGTYQTGNTTPPKSSSLLVAVLLMMVIFLGGIASALGLVNMRLLVALQQTQPDPTVPLKLQAGTEPSESPIFDDTAPEIPEDSVSMMLVDPMIQTAKEVTDGIFLDHVNAATVTVSGGDTLSGTGLVLTENGYILTYAHLVEQQERVYVTLADGSRHRAAVVGCDTLTDLAVVYIQSSDLMPAQFSNTAESYRVWVLRENALHGGAICPGQEVFPLGNGQIPLLQNSAASNREEGALWNSNCQIIGILSPCMAQYFDEEADALAWAIPSSAVKQIVDGILCCGNVPGRPTLCIQTEEVSDLYRNYWQLPKGLLITGSDNPALEEGDILVRLDGCKLSSRWDLNAILFSAQPGDSMDATVIRDGETVRVSVTVSEETCEE